MDPIMWDPFRYKLGGRLLNNRGEEFAARYGAAEEGKYVLTRDVATYGILKEVEAGRGSPHGGVYLSFQHCGEDALRAAFGPVIDRLAANNIDLTKTPVEVAPIAHYHMGGVQADARMETEVPGLLVAGEAVGGANGANRLSGNAITEALVFGRRAGRTAAERIARASAPKLRSDATREAVDLITSGPSDPHINTAHMVARLQSAMANDVGPLRTRDGLARALSTITDLEHALGDRPAGDGKPFDLVRLDWLDLRNMLLVARVVTQVALARTESRGAHQREDFPDTGDEWRVNQVTHWRNGRLAFTAPKVATAAAAQ
jgi:succinate dehydrogenase/fumarate reductase flavoprotein subunit